MTNPFSNIINSSFKNIFNNAIDALLEDKALSVPCTITYGSSNNTLCSNCIFDPMSRRSLNQYNGIGPNPFTNNTICPVCNGYGLLDKAKTEKIYLAVIFDSKYWFNWNDKQDAIHIPDGSVQTISNISLMPKIKSCQYMTMDSNIQGYGDHSYALAGDPQPCGLGDNRYIISMWTRA